MVHSYIIYVWDATLGEELPCERELKDGQSVGHTHMKELEFAQCLKKSSQVTGSRQDFATRWIRGMDLVRN